MKRDKIVLLSGASGFIGQHLLQKLTREGYAVKKIKNLISLKKINFKPVAIVHLAAVSNIKAFSLNQPYAYKVNVLGTLNLLELAKKTRAHFIFASSSAVYGQPMKPKVSETHPLVPLSGYGRSKLIGEKLCENFYHHEKVPVSVLRFFNIYGPNQKTPFLIPSILDSLKKGKKVDLRNPGFERDYLYIDDLTSLISRLVRKKRNEFLLFNVGSGKPKAIKDVVKNISDVTKLKIQWKKSSERRQKETSRIYADIRNVKKKLGWVPRVSFREGLKGTLSQN